MGLSRRPTLGEGRGLRKHGNEVGDGSARRDLASDAPISVAPGGSGERRRAGLRWAAAVLGGVALLVLVVARVGTEKLTPSESVGAQQVRHGTWSEMFDLDGIASAIPLPLWMLALVAAGLIGFPYAWLVARALPDRGYAVSRAVGLLLVTWVAWWISSLRALPFGRVSIVVAASIVAAGAVAIVVSHREELVIWIRGNWRLILLAEGLFWAFFAAVLFVRWSNPDLWHATRGGEKPMDFAYLNAVAKSSSFPPFDPWFAGGQMNYYYYGFVQVASLAKLTGIPPAVAYNLAVPTLAGLLGSASFCAALGLTPTRWIRTRTSLGVASLGAVFVTALGNLGEIRVIRSALDQTVPVEWWFWNPTRVIHPGEGEPGPITEFPAFTFIYGDLHAHAMALPVAALALTLTVALVRTRGGPRSLAPCVGLLGLTLGTLWVTNTWDLPTYGLVAVSGLAIATVLVDRTRRGVLTFLAGAAALAGVAYLAFLPFQLHYESVFEGVQRWEGRQTRLFDYVTIHGLFLFAIVSGLLVQLLWMRDLGGVARAVRLVVRHRHRVGRLRRLDRALVRGTALHRAALLAVPVALLVAGACAVLGQWPAAVALPIAVLAVLSWPTRRRRGVGALDQALRRLLIVLVVIGLTLTVAVEYYVLRLVDIGRVNTVFKLYLEVWVLWAIAAAVSVGTVYEAMPRLRSSVGEIWRIAFLGLLAVALSYPILAARAKIDDRFDTSVGRTLDGTAFMERAVHRENEQEFPLASDRDGIRWMLENVTGSPVVAEVNTAPTLYGWESRYAMFTGNPTIVGWDFHQRQQRPAMSERVRTRVVDVQRAYATRDPAVAHSILTYYGAKYVVVGELERAYFPEGTDKWERGVGRYWRLAYANPGVRIYRVASSDAPGSS